MSVTVRGQAKVRWKPDFTLTFSSTDGLSLDPGTTTHPLVATLTNTADGSAVEGRTIRLTTNPTPRIGDTSRRVTDVNGQATFNVSNPSVESVIYTASLIPRPPTTEPTVTESLTITWGGTICDQCNNDLNGSPPELFTPDDQRSLGWNVKWSVRTMSGPDCLTETFVSHVQGFYLIFPGGAEPVFTEDVQNVTFEDSPFLTQPEIDALIISQTVDYDALIAQLSLDLC